MGKTDKDYGIVYVLENPAMPGLVKIGKTSRLDLDVRMKELYSTGVPLPFSCVYACKVKTCHMGELEKALHAAFAPMRVNENREFFRISREQVIPLLTVMNHFNEGDVTAEVSAELEEEMDPSDKAAVAKVKAHKRPSLDFFALGLNPGDTLVFAKNPDITVSVATNKKVVYNGMQQSLTAVTTSLLGSKWSVQPTPYWEVNGENLRDRYDSVFPLSEE